MQETIEQQPTQTPVPKVKRSLAGRIVRGILTIITILLILSASLITFTQTSWFRNIVASQLEKLVAEKTNGTLTLGRIDGDFITGFTIYDAHLKLRSEVTDLISVNQIYAKYSLWKFISGKDIPVSDLVLRSPIIHFIKYAGNTVWNYEQLIPSQPSTGKSTPFNLAIDLENFRIENGRFSAEDQNTKARTDSAIDWQHLAINDIDLDMSAKVVGEKIQHAQITNLSFEMASTKIPFRLHHLELAALHDNNHVEIGGMKLISDRSDVKLSAMMDNLSVLNGDSLESLEHSKTILLLNAKYISTQELAQFLPDLTFLGSNPSLDLEAKGEFGKLKVVKGILGLHSDGKISFSGEIRNLHKPEKFYMDVALEGHELTDRSLRDYVPGLSIPDMQRLGTVDIKHLSFKGFTDNFESTFEVATSAGSLSGTAALDFRQKQMIYDAAIATKNVNLSSFLADSNFKSNLNIAAQLQGRGTDPKTMNAQFHVVGDGRTGFKNYSITELDLHGKIDSGKLEFDDTKLKLADSASLTSSFASLEIGKPDPEYELDLTTKNVSVTEILPIFPKNSKLSVEANLRGKGISTNTVAGSMKVELSGLQENQKPLPKITLNATLGHDETPEHNRVDIIVSSIADLAVKGRYDVEALAGLISGRVANIISAINTRGAIDTASFVEEASDQDTTHLTYKLTVKDLHPASPFFPNVICLGSGSISGAIDGSAKNTMSITADGDIHNLLLKPRFPLRDTSGIPSLLLKDAKCQVSISNITPQNIDLLKHLNANFTFLSDSTQKLESLTFDKPQVDISLSSGQLSYKLSTITNKYISAYLSGTGDISKPDLTFQTDSLSLLFGKTYQWYNDRKSEFTIGTNGMLKLDTIELIRPFSGYDPTHIFAQRIKIGFSLRGDTINYAFLQSPRLDLTDITAFIPTDNSSLPLPHPSGRANKLNIFMNGTLVHPEVSVDLGLKNFTYDNDPESNITSVTLDNADLHLNYLNTTLRGKGIFHVDSLAYAADNLRERRSLLNLSNESALSLDIDSIPLLFSLKSDPNFRTDSIQIEDKPLSIRATGHEFPIDMFGPIVPVIAKLHGISDITFGINGTRKNILYTGLVDVREGSFWMPTTNMDYDFNGKLRMLTDTLRFEDMHVRNSAAENEIGSGVVNGYFAFKGFIVQDFSMNFDANRIRVLSEASKETLKNVYGPLTISSFGGPLNFSGTIERPKLSGKLRIDQGFLTLPQDETSSVNLYDDGIIYGSRYSLQNPPKTGSVSDPVVEEIVNIVGDSSRMEDYDKIFEKQTQSVLQNREELNPYSGPKFTFQDKMLYDLEISIPGDLWFTIDLNKALGIVKQNIVAEVRSSGSIFFNRTEQGAAYSTNATINLTDKSSYTLLKEFNPVSGTLTFVNDLSNPSLDITAEYTGQHKLTSNTEETIRIRLHITGTKENVDLFIELFRKNSQGEFIKDPRTQVQVKEDVLTYLTNGNFVGDAQGINQGSNAGYSLVSTLASKEITDVLRSTVLHDYLRSVGYEFGGLQSHKLKLSGKVGKVVYSLGAAFNGTTAGNSSLLSSDFRAEIPFSVFANFPKAENLILQGEGHTSAGGFGSQDVTQQPLLLFRLAYRISQ
ncbi:MAG: hypothetical protein WCH46_01320 [bacterium]